MFPPTIAERKQKSSVSVSVSQLPLPTTHTLNRRTLTMSQQPTNQPQKISVLNDQSEKLVGLLHDTGSKEVVILCHGFLARKEHKIMVNICNALEKEGISAYRFDFSGNGESDGSFAFGNYMKEVEDIQAVVKYFNGTNRVVSAIAGHSKGGDDVLLYASKYHDVRTVVNMSGRYDLKNGLVERLGEDFMERIKTNGYIDIKAPKTGETIFRVTEGSLMERLNIDMHEAAVRIDKSCRSVMGDLNYFYGGYFVADPVMRYMGAEVDTYFGFDPDLLDYWELLRLGKECVKGKADKDVDGIYLHLPGRPFEDGLVKLCSDKEVLMVGQVLEKHKMADLYVVQKKTFSRMGKVHWNSEIPFQSDKLCDVVVPTCNKELVGEIPSSNTNPPTSNNPTEVPQLNTSISLEKSEAPSTRSTSQILKLLCSQQEPPSTLSPQSSPITRSRSVQSHQPTTSSVLYSCSSSKKLNFREKLPIKSSKKTAEIKANEQELPQVGEQGGVNIAAETNKDASEQELPPDFHIWEDLRPDSPIPLNELIGDLFSEGSDYIPSEEADSEECDGDEGDEGDDEDEDITGTLFEKGGCSRQGELDDEDGCEGRSEGEADDDLDARSVSLVDGGSDDDIAEARQLIDEWEKERKRQLEIAKAKVLENLKPSKEAQAENAEGDSEFDDDSDADQLLGGENSGDEGTGRRVPRAPTVTKYTDFKKFKWVPGTRFTNKESFRDALTRFALAQGRNLVIRKSDKNRGHILEARCKVGCPFRIYASWDKREEAYIVKSVSDTHSCTRDIMSNRQLKSSWVAKEMLELFKVKPHLPASETIECIKKSFNIVIKPGVAYKIKRLAHSMLHGSMHDHYGKIGSYIQALLEHNPTSSFLLDTVPSPTDGPPIFRRMFIGFEGLKKAFLAGCRKVICLDGCFLKTFLGGILLVAIATDANNQMLPLCWAVAEGENNDSWYWFLNNFKIFIGGTDGVGWTIMSDQQKGLLNAVGRLFPSAEHRNCARHIYQNWQKNYKGDELKEIFWDAVSAYCQADFQKAMDNMKRVSQEAAEAFIAQDPRTFCRTYFATITKCDMVVNNMAESFNAAIVDARAKHIIFMLEDIRHMVMQSLPKKKAWMEKSKIRICPKVQDKLEKSKELASNCSVTPSSNMIFEVKYSLDDVVVNMAAGSCTCRRWDVSGIPCAHVAAVANFLRREPEDFVSEFLTKDTYLLTYDHSIGPCVGEKHWPKKDLPLEPPAVKAMPGRPKKNRARSAHEDPKKPGKLTKHGVKMHCSICRSGEHTKKICPEKGKKRKSSTTTSTDVPPKKKQKSSTTTATKGSTSTRVQTRSKQKEVAVDARHGKGKGKGKGRGQGAASGGTGGSAGPTASKGRGRGRPRKPKVPVGAGIYVDPQSGQSYFNSPGMSQAKDFSSLSSAPSAVINTQASSTTRKH